MEPRLLKNLQAEYIAAQWSGKNTSGVRVVGKTVLVLMDKCSPVTSGEAGLALLKEAGIQPTQGGPVGTTLTPDQIERMDMASETGVLVAVAEGAFCINEDGSAWSGEKPKPGDRVYVEKYSGQLVKGRDGLTYRLMDYHSIGATYEPVAEDAA